MPTAAERASRLRQTLRARLADYQQRLEDLLALRQLLKGSVYELKTRCGKPSRRDSPCRLLRRPVGPHAH